MTTGPEAPKIPAHIAVIMDGNGRWAKEKGLHRVRGHEEGAETVRRITRECTRLGVKRLTLYAFSSDNWKRPAHEVEFLMALLQRYLAGERREIMENRIRFRTIGRRTGLPDEVRREIDDLVEVSRTNPGMVLSLALNYGGREEIVDAARRIAEDARRGIVDPAAIDEVTFGKYLYDPGAEDPDLLIRTGGDVRVSNFLLWQISYTELWVTPVKWPDFTVELLREAIRDFSARERRFGGIADE
ncbi:MAG: isoprenyl transferase [Planctomycetes bacterium]|nr:isoprenyl transferase [Planctomycetota bacterium]